MQTERGDFLLCARLHTADKRLGSRAPDEIKWIVKRMREDWPEVEIWFRGDIKRWRVGV